MERDQASKFINDLLKLMVSRNGSDLFITGDFPPAMKVDGKVTKVSPQPLNSGHTLALARSIMSDKAIVELCALIGHYIHGAIILNAGEVPAPEDASVSWALAAHA